MKTAAERTPGTIGKDCQSLCAGAADIFLRRRMRKREGMHAREGDRLTQDVSIPGGTKSPAQALKSRPDFFHFLARSRDLDQSLRRTA